MRRLFLGAGIAGVGGLVIISIFLNYRFGRETGGLQLGVISVCLDLVKIALPVALAIITTAGGHSRALRAGAALAMLAVWLPIALYSSQSAAGAVLLNRSDSTGGRSGIIDQRSSLAAERQRLLAKNPWTARTEQWKAQPAAAISAQLDAHKSGWQWKASDQCRQPDGARQLAFCQLFHTLEAALQVASQAETDRQRLTEIEQRLATLPALVESDPYAKMVADLVKTDQRWVVYAQAALAAFLLELVPNVCPALFILANRLAMAKGPKVCGQAGLSGQTPWPNEKNCLASPLAMASPRPLGQSEKTSKKQRSKVLVDLGQYRLARGQTPLAIHAKVGGHALVAAMASKLGPGQHSLDSIMLEIEQIAYGQKAKPPRRTRVGALLRELGHEHCGRVRSATGRTTMYNFKENNLIVHSG